MNVAQLIEALKALPQDADVLHLWDGHARTFIRHVWLSKGGNVITSDDGMVCYPTNTRPVDAPTREEDEYWTTPDLGK